MATQGTLGDLYPYIAVAKSLQARGHSVLISSSEYHRSVVESCGIDFSPLSPDLVSFYRDSAVQKKAMHPVKGTEYVVRELLLPSIRKSFDELKSICQGADLIVGHFLAYAVPLVAETLNIPWLQICLHPTNLLSANDPPLLPVLPGFERLRFLGPLPYKLAFSGVDAITRVWMRPLIELRRDLGLNTRIRNPITQPWSPHGTMGWFPKALAPIRPDWPARFEVTGYPFLDSSDLGLPLIADEMTEFLTRESPVIFTLGSAAVLQPRQFFEVSARVAMHLGVSALLVGVSAEQARSFGQEYPGLRVARHLPYDQVFPHARLIVHHGGIGSVAQSLRFGKQMLVVPFAWDQPDNGFRIQRLGFGSVLHIKDYHERSAARALSGLLNNIHTTSIVERMKSALREGEGAAAAVNFIEESF